MQIGLIDVDGHNFPNLCLMKISAWHKAQGDTVEWWDGFKRYDKVYMSKVFDNTYTPDMPFCINAGEVIKGGTGYKPPEMEWKDYAKIDKLPHEVEHMMPDYSLYPSLTKDTAYGFLTRGCPMNCPVCIVSGKEGLCSEKVADLSEWWGGEKNIVLLDPNTLACKDHMDLLRQLSQSGVWVDFTQGLDCRLLNEDNINALNQIKTKMLHFAWDYMKWSEPVINGLLLYAKLGLVRERKRGVYVLTNYDTTMDENLYRIYKLREMCYDPYVMVYDKPNAPKEIKRLQRWVNNRRIWRTCERFEDYKP